MGKKRHSESGVESETGRDRPGAAVGGAVEIAFSGAQWMTGLRQAT
jgi:hypothetical protein